MKLLPHFIFFLSLVMLLHVSGIAQPNASWEGLVGLYMQPTAETFSPGEIALTYSELRFQQERGSSRSKDIWFTASATATLTPHWEVGLALRNEDYNFFQGNTMQPTLNIQKSKFIGNVKYIIAPPQDRRIGVAVGVQDITDATNNLDGLVTDRGRRFFAVGSYRGAHLGLTYDNHGLGEFAGANFNVSDSVDLIAELVSKTSFTGIQPAPANKINFNLGLRFTPRNNQRLRADVAAIGDGKFDFGFSFSYRLKL